MKLLIATQTVDTTDPALGFFHEWIKELAKHFESITVVCLRKGEYSLPKNVEVVALGSGFKFTRALEVCSIAYGRRGEYDVVFVHMSQEFVLAAGWLWMLLGKPVYLWRNHYAGSFLTDIAAAFSKKVFCTSKYSYTAKYKKTVLMPVGVDTELFKSDLSVSRTPHSILFLARFAPSKKPELLIEALGVLHKNGTAFQATIVGSALPAQAAYRNKVIARAKELSMTQSVIFREGVSHAEASRLFSTHEIFVNLSETGTYDKTMFEAALSGCLVVSMSKDFAGLTGSRFFISSADPSAVLGTIREALSLSSEDRARIVANTRDTILKMHSLEALAKRIAEQMI